MLLIVLGKGTFGDWVALGIGYVSLALTVNTPFSRTSPGRFGSLWTATTVLLVVCSSRKYHAFCYTTLGGPEVYLTQSCGDSKQSKRGLAIQKKTKIHRFINSNRAGTILWEDTPSYELRMYIIYSLRGLTRSSICRAMSGGCAPPNFVFFS